MTWIVVALLISSVCALYVLPPLLSTPSESGIGPVCNKLTELVDAKERSLRAIKDLELDFAMGKIAADEYEPTRSELVAEASHALQELKRHGAK
jgi:hypothetical protein